MIDGQILILLGLVGVALVVGTLVGRGVGRLASTARERARAADLQQRIRAWWVLIPIMVGCLALEHPGILGFFVVASALSLRELVTLLPTRRADHLALLLTFVVAVPLQYGLVYHGWITAFLAFVPLWALLVIPGLLAMAGDATQFVRRVASLQFTVLVALYALGHGPALLYVDVPQPHHLLVFLVVVTQVSDILQFIAGRLLGRTPLSTLTPHKSWEGLLVGGAGAVLVGVLLTPLLPYGMVHTLGLATATVAAGALGGLVMSAVKRDAGVKDFGHAIPGHGGIVDRLNGILFAAPVLFHLVYYS